MTEDEIIRAIRGLARARSPLCLKGIGDDCALLASPKSHEAILCTTDLLIEKIHFDLDFTSPYLLGRKSLAVNLSDIAAMGGTPRFYTVSLAVPKGRASKFIIEFYRGLEHVARKFKVSLVGGDLSRSTSDIFVSLTVLGTVEKDEAVFRSGASPGDMIFVTGSLGASATGLKLLREGHRFESARGKEREAILSHLSPVPRCDVGRWLAQRRLATAMMDISDGLSIDLHRLCAESRVGAIVVKDKIPIAKSSSRLENDPLAVALHGGEDYELLFTASASKVSTLLKRYPRRKFPPLTCIGEIVEPSRGVMLKEDGRMRPLRPLGYDHFR